MWKEVLSFVWLLIVLALLIYGFVWMYQYNHDAFQQIFVILGYSTILYIALIFTAFSISCLLSKK